MTVRTGLIAATAPILIYVGVALWTHRQTESTTCCALPSDCSWSEICSDVDSPCQNNYLSTCVPMPELNLFH